MNQDRSKPPPIEEPTLLEQAQADPADVQQSEANRAEQQHYAAIGRVAAAWSYLEALIDTCSLELAEIFDWEMGICFTAQIAGPARKLGAYIALARLLRQIDPKTEKILNVTVETTASLAERRNRVVHDPWFFDYPNPPKRFEATARKRVRLEHIPATTAELLELAQAIKDHSDAIASLADRVKDLPRPSP